jgi:hypothetical protein
MTQLRLTPIHHSESAPPPGVPPGYVGWVFLPGTGKRAWWTGRVAIGARYQPPQRVVVGEGMRHVQTALLHAA